MQTFFAPRLAFGSEYGTGSEEDTLWVLASVALGSALPWKTEHLGASWKGSLPSCPLASRHHQLGTTGPAQARWCPRQPETGRQDQPDTTQGVLFGFLIT